MRFKKLVMGSVCSAVLCGTTMAQETKTNPPVSSQQVNVNQNTGAAIQQGMVSQQQLAACWALDNQEEVILAEFARDKSKNKDVVEFAKMLVDEHQSCLKKLSKFTPEASSRGLLSDNSLEQSKSREGTPGTAARTTNAQNVGAVNAPNSGTTSGLDMMQFHREIAQQCVDDSKKYLSSKSENDFDACFVGMQIAKHAAMHTKLTVLQRHTTGDMNQMVSEGIQATDKHMKAAENLMKKLAHDDDHHRNDRDNRDDQSGKSSSRSEK